ncbi:putative non-specific serine/threonine protein kinase [Helianthus annuus]|nr:putative non-specific serine/threonine protein kinase [Helianthus annuus]
MIAKWPLFIRPVLLAVVVQFATFSTLTNTAAARNSTTGDLLALLAIKSMIKGDPQGLLTSWNHSNTNLCQWQGVTCSLHHKRVTHLNLSHGGLIVVGEFLVMKGQEATYVSILGLVTLLDLSSNNLSGRIPSELTTLHKLKSLNLSRNQLTGKIPNKIGDMKSLESFDLSVNNLSGELPISLSELNFLGTFNVSYNNLIGRIPTGTQIQSFNESSFIGNKLCGAPLTNDCIHVDKPDTTKEGGSHKVDWGLIISIVLGFIAGFWVIVVSLILNRSWRITYFRLMKKLIKV